MAYGGEPIYDEDGFDEGGFDREGYNKDEYDSDGYNPAGIDQYGFNRAGLSWDGFDMDGNHFETSATLFPEEKGIFIGGYEGAGHIWEEIEEYFPNINAGRKREINVGKNQKGEIIVGLQRSNAKPFNLFSKTVGDDFIVNKSLPLTIKRILGIPEDEAKRTYKYNKNVKNEEIENLKKEIQRLKIKSENEIEVFLRYKKDVERWGEDKSRENEQMRLRQIGSSKQIEDMLKLGVEKNKLIDQMKQWEQLKIKQMEEMKQWEQKRIRQIEEMKNQEKINEKEKEKMERLNKVKKKVKRLKKLMN